MSILTSNTAVDLAEIANLKGGFTYRVSDAMHLSSGYAVGIAGHEWQGLDLIGNDVMAYWRLHSDAFTSPNACLGAWYNGSTDVWYLDLSIVVPTLEQALKLAREHGQLAVYDLDNGETIPVDHSHDNYTNPHPGALEP